MDPSCVEWLKQRLELLCPAADSKLRGSSESPAAFIAELFDEKEHTQALDSFLHEDPARTLFAVITPKRALKLSISAPKPAEYAAMMYILCPAKKGAVRWTMTSLSRQAQVQPLHCCAPHGLAACRFVSGCSVLAVIPQLYTTSIFRAHICLTAAL